MSSPIQKVPGLVRGLYSIVVELERLFPGRSFTLDGHLVGSIGEVLAADRYGLRLLKPSSKVHDAKAPDGRLVQVKATQVTQVALSSKPHHLIVLKLGRDGSVREVYNGPGGRVWKQCGPMQRNGQRTISITKLERLMAEIPAADRVPVSRKYPGKGLARSMSS